MTAPTAPGGAPGSHRRRRVLVVETKVDKKPVPPPTAPPRPPLTAEQTAGAVADGVRQALRGRPPWMNDLFGEVRVRPEPETKPAPIPPPPEPTAPVAPVAPAALQPDAPLKATREPITTQRLKNGVFAGIILVLALFVATALLVMGYRFLSGDPVIPQKVANPVVAPATLAPAPAPAAPVTVLFVPAAAPATLTPALPAGTVGGQPFTKVECVRQCADAAASGDRMLDEVGCAADSACANLPQ